MIAVGRRVGLRARLVVAAMRRPPHLGFVPSSNARESRAQAHKPRAVGQRGDGAGRPVAGQLAKPRPWGRSCARGAATPRRHPARSGEVPCGSVANQATTATVIVGHSASCTTVRFPLASSEFDLGSSSDVVAPGGARRAQAL